MLMIIDSPASMFDLGKKLAKQHHVIFLYGELGAGKTHFTQGFASGIGINHLQVQSPTYTYVNIYDHILLHIDMYRLQNHEDLITKGILDQIHQYEYIVIERPKFEKYYQDIPHISIHIEKTSPTIRTLSIS